MRPFQRNSGASILSTPRLYCLKTNTPRSEPPTLDRVKRRTLRYAISNRNAFAGDQQTRIAGLLEQAAALATDGVDFLQLREKDLPAAELASLARALLHTLRGSHTKLLINSRADVALATAAHGVHLTSSPGQFTPRQIHELYAAASLPTPIVTLSCHTLEEIVRHRLEPLTAILFGPVFEKVVSGEPTAEGTGLALLERACAAAAPTPVLALGGITPTNTPACLHAGAAGVAGIRLFARP